MLLNWLKWRNQMAETRTPREVSSREKTARMEYRPASSLPEPTPEAGYVFHWVATHVLGNADPTNVSKKMREGWEPVRAEDHPELALFAGKTGNVELGGLMLCKMPKELYDSRSKYYNQQSSAQIDAVDNNLMRQNDPRMPLFKERKSTTSRGAGFGSGS
jgi:hypothetical protein